MNKKYNVTVKGTGQLNGPVRINKTIEFEENVAKTCTGAKKESVITDFCKTHYPGVKINPKSIGVNVVLIKETSEKSKDTSSSKSKTQEVKSNSNNSESFSSPVIISVPELTKEEKEEIKREEKKRSELLEIETLKKQEEELKLEQLRFTKKMEFELNKQKTEETRIQKMNSLIDFNNSVDTESITKHLDDLLVYLSGFNLSSDEKNENHYFDKLFSKYKLYLNKLKSTSSDTERIKYYSKQVNKYKFRRFCIRIAHFLNNN